MAGDETTIAALRDAKRLARGGRATCSRRSSFELVADPGFPALIARAREAYAERRNGMVEALAALGIEAHGRLRLNVWVPVREEAATVRALQEAGWLVLAGERFRIATPPGIRITISTLRPGRTRRSRPRLRRSSAPIARDGCTDPRLALRREPSAVAELARVRAAVILLRLQHALDVRAGLRERNVADDERVSVRARASASHRSTFVSPPLYAASASVSSPP